MYLPPHPPNSNLGCQSTPPPPHTPIYIFTCCSSLTRVLRPNFPQCSTRLHPDFHRNTLNSAYVLEM